MHEAARGRECHAMHSCNHMNLKGFSPIGFFNEDAPASLAFFCFNGEKGWRRMGHSPDSSKFHYPSGA